MKDAGFEEKGAVATPKLRTGCVLAAKLNMAIVPITGEQ